MVELTMDQAQGSLDTRINRLGKFMTDAVLDDMARNCIDEHYKQDVSGIRSVLHGEYMQAAKVLSAENDFVSQNPDYRTESKNGMVAMASTMCAVSLLKLGKFADAERLLKNEVRLDANGWNKDAVTKAINQDALRIALLQQGKYGEVELSNAVGNTADVKKALQAEFTDIAKNCPDVYLDEHGQRKGLQVTQETIEERMDRRHNEYMRLKDELQKTSDANTRQQIQDQMRNFDNLYNNDAALKMDVEGMRKCVHGDWAGAEAVLKISVNAADQSEDFRKLFPGLTVPASSMYGYSLLALNRWSEAEARFRTEVERDRTGKNPIANDFKKLNMLGLQFALLKQGKYEEASKLQNRTEATQIPAVTFRPALQSVR